MGRRCPSRSCAPGAGRATASSAPRWRSSAACTTRTSSPSSATASTASSGCSSTSTSPTRPSTSTSTGAAGRRWIGRGGGRSPSARRRASLICTKIVIRRLSIVTSRQPTSFWITTTSQRLQILAWPNTKEQKPPLFLRA
uniref:Uncharacterized protein n=1 Tax=Arundo donax TaxID=35708 RepID=A0A0A8XVF8_ARUDO